MKILVTIVVYNRFNNIQRWLKCWKQCKTENAELIIIHTGTEIQKFKDACENSIVTYIHRENIGFDIGSFQDVCKERLSGFPNDWDYLLWCTDDTFPMTKDFIKPFMHDKPVGLTCMQISRSKPGNIVHVRTTGFCISKAVSQRLTFPADPIKTKQDCYHFEHKGGKQILSEQVRAMGLDVVQVAPNATSPLWDSGFWKRLDRQREHDLMFGYTPSTGDKVTIIATIYDSYPQIISCLLLQTHKNWQLYLIHDGPAPDSVKSSVPEDDRIKFIETPARVGNWGHKNRQTALQEYDLGDYVLVTNSDNYYTPVFIEYILKGFKRSHTAVAVYCSDMVHSYKAWQTIPCRLERGFLDAGGVVVRSEVAKEVGWRDTETHSADWVYFQDIAMKYSWSNFLSVKGNLFVHN